MKSYWMSISEGQGRMELREVDRPVPGADQVLVKLNAASLNRGELIIGHGLHGKDGSKPAGMEGAGHIVQIGSETGAWQVGDRVMGRCPGAFAEYALMDVREIMLGLPHPPEDIVMHLDKDKRSRGLCFFKV